MSRSLLYTKNPLVINPELAAAIGLNEAIILQQMRYWLDKSTHRYDGRAWIYNTYDQWAEQFPFWTARGIRSIITRLEADGLVLSTTKYNHLAVDKTKWYTIDFDHEKLRDTESADHASSRDTWETPSVPHGLSPRDASSIKQRLRPETTAETNFLVRGKNADKIMELGRKAKPKPDGYTVEFEAFWKSYPATGGSKKDAFSAWKKLDIDVVLLQQIEDGLNAWKSSDRWQRGIVRHPSTWLNAESWENPPAPVNVSQFPSTPRYGKDIGLSTDEAKRRHFERFGVAL